MMWALSKFPASRPSPDIWLAADNLALRAGATVAAIHALLGVSATDVPQ